MDLSPLRVIATAAASLVVSIGIAPAADTSVEAYGRLLAKYVTPAGVCYDAWRAQPADVKALAEAIRDWTARDPGTLAPADRKALLINLYNAKILEIVLTDAPKGSIKEVTPGITGFGVFRRPALTLAGKTISLTELEDGLREDFKDPRIHFAINCASKSCPPIASEPYRGSTLDAQLDRSVRAFLAAPGALAVSGGTRISCSRIFDWYAKDFAPTGGVKPFLETYAPAGTAAAIKAAGGAATLDYQDYDWSLNRTSACGAP